MLDQQHARRIRLAVLGLGILGGLWGCLAYLSAMFTVGVNDSPAEVWAITFALATPLPACLIALWKRFVPGLWLLFAGGFLPYGVLAQRHYMIHVRHFDQPGILLTLLGALPMMTALFLLGGFCVVTNSRGWPEILGTPDNS